jgi:hypothetical protein
MNPRTARIRQGDGRLGVAEARYRMKDSADTILSYDFFLR